jgi:hypothetical protein
MDPSSVDSVMMIDLPLLQSQQPSLLVFGIAQGYAPYSLSSISALSPVWHLVSKWLGDQKWEEIEFENPS